jgi:uncharacterized YigZ family protein
MRATVKFSLHPGHAAGRCPPGPAPKEPTRHHHLDFLTVSPSRRMMYSLATTYTRELEIRKSRFIAYAIPVDDRDAAMQALQRLRDEHPAATHVCWALLAGGQSGMSDDGEPSGTAGRPILEVLRHHDLDGVLGAGGLVRAYTDAIASALLDAERVERIRYTRLAIEIGYPEEARVRRWIEQAGYELVDSAYGMTVKLVIKLPETADAHARTELFDLTQGRSGFPDL